MYGFTKEALSTMQSAMLHIPDAFLGGAISGAGSIHGLVRGVQNNPEHPWIGGLAGNIRGAWLPFHDEPYHYGQGIFGSNAGPAQQRIPPQQQNVEAQIDAAQNNRPSAEDVQLAQQKVGAFYGFSKEAAMAVPGLLQQMTSGAGRMGTAVNIAGQRALRGFDASRNHVGAGMLDSLRNAGTQGVNSLMRSQAGQNALMAGGAALGTGTLAATGYGAYRALRSSQAQQPQAQPL